MEVTVYAIQREDGKFYKNVPTFYPDIEGNWVTALSKARFWRHEPLVLPGQHVRTLTLALK